MAVAPHTAQSFGDWIFRPLELPPSEPRSFPPLQISLPGAHTLTTFQPSVSATPFNLHLQPMFAWFCGGVCFSDDAARCKIGFGIVWPWSDPSTSTCNRLCDLQTAA